MLPRNERPREKLVEDRTGCHADMAGLYPYRHAVAAVGFVQGMDGVYDLKDIIAFHAGDMDRLADACGLYFQEEPKDQLLDPQFWADDAKLNQLRRMGIRYAHVRLQCDDIYFIPRKVVHQFKTVGACVSVTWHLKHRSYYSADGIPNQLIGFYTEESSDGAAPAVVPVVSPSKKPLLSSRGRGEGGGSKPSSPAPSSVGTPGASTGTSTPTRRKPGSKAQRRKRAPAAKPAADAAPAPPAKPADGDRRAAARDGDSDSDSASLGSSDFEGLSSDSD